MTSAHHWPPELSKLVGQAVARLNKGKRGVLSFFAACGVPDALLVPWRRKLDGDPNSVSKFAMADELTFKINQRPESNEFIRIRREVIRRIVETKSFEQCWADDQPIAHGLVASIREMVDERDFFAKTIAATERLQEERQRERAKGLKAESARATQREALRKRFYALFSPGLNPQKRGYDFQKLLVDLFSNEGILIREPFTVGTSEQIDGAITLDGSVYLVEAKWWAEKLSHKDVSDLYVKISTRPLHTRGLFISGSGYTDECVEVCVKARMSQVILVACEDLVDCFENALTLSEMIRKKAEYAMTEGRILVSTREIIEKLR